jgi:hypothetical protein
MSHKATRKNHKVLDQGQEQQNIHLQLNHHQTQK